VYIGGIKWVASHRPPLARLRSPAAAAVVGLVFGAIGIGIYFRSFADFVLSTVLTMIMSLAFIVSGSTTALLLCMCAPGVYGFHRVRRSNVRLVAGAGT
jgi:hypothetical protein